MVAQTKVNNNLSPEQAQAMRSIAAQHGLVSTTGPKVGQGSIGQLNMALITGDVQTVSLEAGDLAMVVPWLREQAQAAPALLAEVLEALADDLGWYLPSEPLRSSGAEPADINTLDG